MKEKILNLYAQGEIGVDGLIRAVNNGWITMDEAVNLVGEEKAFDLVQRAKLAEISAACNAIIEHGIDITLGGETVHFNLDLKDQSNIGNLFKVVELGGTQYPYQADGGVCRIYTAAEIAQLYTATQTHITTQTTYHNALKEYVLTLTKPEELAAITYGMELPEEFAAKMAEKLAVAKAQMGAIIARLGQGVTDHA